MDAPGRVHSFDIRYIDSMLPLSQQLHRYTPGHERGASQWASFTALHRTIPLPVPPTVITTNQTPTPASSTMRFPKTAQPPTTASIDNPTARPTCEGYVAILFPTPQHVQQLRASLLSEADYLRLRGLTPEDLL